MTLEEKRARQREASRKWREANPERKREIARDSARRRYATNPKAAREATRKWCKTNPEAAREATRRWRDANREATRESYRKWQKANREKKRTNEQRRRARLLDGCSPGVTPEQWLEIVETFDGRCAYCLRKRLPLERDHVIPLKRGGRDEPDNVVPACERCNCSKNASILPLWYARVINEARI